MLRECGVSYVKEADDGDSALVALRASTDQCSFIILDWVMPRMSGIDAAIEIRADYRLQDIPILIVTGVVDMDQVLRAGEVGVDGYIIKPFGTKTLNEKIISILKARSDVPIHVKLVMNGQALVAKGEYDEALKVVAEAEKYSDSARVLALMGEIYEKKGDNKAAADYYKKAIKKNPLYLKAYLLASDLFMKTKDNAVALAYLEKASEISPNVPERLMKLGFLYMKNGESNNAHKTYQTVVAIDPNKGPEIAEKYLKKGKADLAEGFLRKSLMAKPDDVNIYNRLGMSLRRQGRWKDAVKEYENALNVNPHSGALYYNMGKAYMEGECADEARRCFRKALELDPSLNAAKKELSGIRK